jgi:hypothetical protein
MALLLGFSLLAFAEASAADGLTDVRAALHALSSAEPVRGTFVMQQSVASSGRFANSKNERLAKAEVAHDASGVTVTVPQELVQRMVDHAPAHAADAATAEDAIGSIRLRDVIETLNARDLLLDMIEGASLVEDKAAPFNARPAKRLVLRLKPKDQQPGTSIQLGSSKSEDRLTLWVGDDRLPMAAERNESKTTGFMFVKGTYSSHSSYTFVRQAGRLLLTKLEVKESGSGLGQQFNRKSVQLLTPH